MLRVVLVVMWASCVFPPPVESIKVLYVQACQGSDSTVLVSSTVSHNYSDAFLVLLNCSACRCDPPYTYRILTSVPEESEQVVFIAREGTNVLSWTVPYAAESFETRLTNVSRMMVQCPPPKRKGYYMQSKHPVIEGAIHIDIVTNSQTELPFNLSVQLVRQYDLRFGGSYRASVGPGYPQVFYFEFPGNTTGIRLGLESESKTCAFISVQNTSNCPVNDLLSDAMSKGLHQTMSTDAVLTVTRDELEDASFFLVLIGANSSLCHTQKSDIETWAVKGVYESKYVNITVYPLRSASEFIPAILAPIWVCLATLVVTLLVFCNCMPKWLWKPLQFGKPTDHLKEDLSAAEPVLSSASHSRYGITNDSPDIDHLKEDYSSAVKPVLSSASRSHYGITTDSSDIDTTCAQHEDDNDERFNSLSAIYKPDSKLRIPSMSKCNFYQLDSQYNVYAWNTITVGIFYALPAFQLVISQQLSLRTDGNGDQCYYNFKCAVPYGVLSAFNNVWSNIGYILLGTIFIIIVTIRKCQVREAVKKDRKFYRAHALPQFFGVYYAMGIAMVMEGLMSGFYHICPSGANFQFDTAFMFIIGGLLLAKIFQNRHPDFHANAFIAFFCFAVVIFFTFLGIYFDSKNTLATRIALLAIVMGIVIVYFVSMYYFHQWQYIWKAVKSNLCSRLQCTGPRCIPTHKVRFGKLVFTFLLNLIPALLAIVQRDRVDAATVVLIFFLLNATVFLLLYIFSKCFYREPWTVAPYVMMAMLGLTWGSAFYFFVTKVSSWTKTPAESRSFNKPCVLFGFYDNHDVWHFLSASALFFSFLLIFTMDDGLANIQREEIHAF
ncbi:hypothetical protein EMCRGX_G011378 [Ephydatia muelleri]